MTYQKQLSALADETRMAVFRRIVERPRSVAEIAAAFTISRPAVSQHIRVLREAGLVSECRQGSRRIYSAEPESLTEILRALGQLQRQALRGISSAATKRTRDPRLQEEADPFQIETEAEDDTIDDRITGLSAALGVSDSPAFTISARITLLDTILKRPLSSTYAKEKLRAGDGLILAELCAQRPSYESSPASIARALKMTLTGVAQHIKHLSALKLVEVVSRRRGATGGIVRLTPRGLAVERELVLRWNEDNPLTPILETLPKHDLAETNRLLRQLLLALDPPFPAGRA